MIDPFRADNRWSSASASPSRRGNVAGITILSLSLLCVALITLSPTSETASLPFLCFRCGAHAGVDVLLNILLFVPVGVGLGLLRVRARWALLFTISATLTVEVLQFGFIAGRFASVRDIVMNVAGGLTGWHLALVWRTLVSPPAAHARALCFVAAASWIASQAFTAWAIIVVAPPPPWWAQISLSDRAFPAVFRGDVVRVSLGTVQIRSSDKLEESEIVRKQLLDGAAVNAVVTGVEPTQAPAPILLLATDDELSEVAALVQTGDDVFFRIRTRAAVVGLRNPSLRLVDVFPFGSGHDTIALEANHADGRYRIASQRGAIHRERTLAASPSWIWALLMPVAHYSLGADVRILTAVWLFAALGLVGFWGEQGSAITGRDPRRARARAALSIVVASIMGLAAVPVVFQLPISHWSEWLAAGVGAMSGWLVGHRVRGRAAEIRRGAAFVAE